MMIYLLLELAVGFLVLHRFMAGLSINNTASVEFGIGLGFAI